jgi:2-dehydropantoate 2-reductase
MSVSSSPQQRLTVAVVGLGSVGSVAAACLAAAQRHEIVACVRKPLARLTLERGAERTEVALRALTDPAAAKPVDWVLLCTKTPATASAAPWLRQLCTPATTVAVLQNGIDQVARVAPLAGGATVIPVIVYYNGERLAPDRVRVRQVGDDDFIVADDAAGRAFARLFDGTPLRVRLAEDFTTPLWRKLLMNATANPISALTLQRQAVFRRADIQALCHAVLAEAIAVGRAEGANLAADEAERIMAQLLGYSPELGTSMYFDRLAGRPLEVDALTGAIVAAGERHGIATPINRALLTLLRAVNDAAESTKN